MGVAVSQPHIQGRQAARSRSWHIVNSMTIVSPTHLALKGQHLHGAGDSLERQILAALAYYGLPLPDKPKGSALPEKFKEAETAVQAASPSCPSLGCERLSSSATRLPVAPATNRVATQRTAISSSSRAAKKNATAVCLKPVVTSTRSKSMRPPVPEATARGPAARHEAGLKRPDGDLPGNLKPCQYQQLRVDSAVSGRRPTGLAAAEAQCKVKVAKPQATTRATPIAPAMSSSEAKGRAGNQHTDRSSNLSRENDSASCSPDVIGETCNSAVSRLFSAVCDTPGPTIERSGLTTTESGMHTAAQQNTIILSEVTRSSLLDTKSTAMVLLESVGHSKVAPLGSEESFATEAAGNLIASQHPEGGLSLCREKDPASRSPVNIGGDRLSSATSNLPCPTIERSGLSTIESAHQAVAHQNSLTLPEVTRSCQSNAKSTVAVPCKSVGLTDGARLGPSEPVTTTKAGDHLMRGQHSDGRVFSRETDAASRSPNIIRETINDTVSQLSSTASDIAYSTIERSGFSATESENHTVAHQNNIVLSKETCSCQHSTKSTVVDTCESAKLKQIARLGSPETATPADTDDNATFRSHCNNVETMKEFSEGAAAAASGEESKAVSSPSHYQELTTPPSDDDLIHSLCSGGSLSLSRESNPASRSSDIIEDTGRILVSRLSSVACGILCSPTERSGLSSTESERHTVAHQKRITLSEATSSGQLDQKSTELVTWESVSLTKVTRLGLSESDTTIEAADHLLQSEQQSNVSLSLRNENGPASRSPDISKETRAVGRLSSAIKDLLFPTIERPGFCTNGSINHTGALQDHSEVTCTCQLDAKSMVTVSCESAGLTKAVLQGWTQSVTTKEAVDDNATLRSDFNSTEIVKEFSETAAVAALAKGCEVESSLSHDQEFTTSPANGCSPMKRNDGTLQTANVQVDTDCRQLKDMTLGSIECLEGAPATYSPIPRYSGTDAPSGNMNRHVVQRANDRMRMVQEKSSCVLFGASIDTPAGAYEPVWPSTIYHRRALKGECRCMQPSCDHRSNFVAIRSYDISSPEASPSNSGSSIDEASAAGVNELSDDVTLSAAAIRSAGTKSDFLVGDKIVLEKAILEQNKANDLKKAFILHPAAVLASSEKLLNKLNDALDACPSDPMPKCRGLIEDLPKALGLAETLVATLDCIKDLWQKQGSPSERTLITKEEIPALASTAKEFDQGRAAFDDIVFEHQGNEASTHEAESTKATAISHADVKVVAVVPDIAAELHLEVQTSCTLNKENGNNAFITLPLDSFKSNKENSQILLLEEPAVSEVTVPERGAPFSTENDQKASVSSALCLAVQSTASLEQGAHKPSVGAAAGEEKHFAEATSESFKSRRNRQLSEVEEKWALSPPFAMQTDLTAYNQAETNETVSTTCVVSESVASKLVIAPLKRQLTAADHKWAMAAPFIMPTKEVCQPDAATNAAPAIHWHDTGRYEPTATQIKGNGTHTVWITEPRLPMDMKPVSYSGPRPAMLNQASLAIPVSSGAICSAPAPFSSTPVTPFGSGSASKLESDEEALRIAITRNTVLRATGITYEIFKQNMIRDEQRLMAMAKKKAEEEAQPDQERLAAAPCLSSSQAVSLAVDKTSVSALVRTKPTSENTEVHGTTPEVFAKCQALEQATLGEDLGPLATSAPCPATHSATLFSSKSIEHAAPVANGDPTKYKEDLHDVKRSRAAVHSACIEPDLLAGKNSVLEQERVEQIEANDLRKLLILNPAAAATSSAKSLGKLLELLDECPSQPERQRFIGDLPNALGLAEKFIDTIDCIQDRWRQTSGSLSQSPQLRDADSSTPAGATNDSFDRGTVAFNDIAVQHPGEKASVHEAGSTGASSRSLSDAKAFAFVSNIPAGHQGETKTLFKTYYGDNGMPTELTNVGSGVPESKSDKQVSMSKDEARDFVQARSLDLQAAISHTAKSVETMCELVKVCSPQTREQLADIASNLPRALAMAKDLQNVVDIINGMLLKQASSPPDSPTAPHHHIM